MKPISLLFCGLVGGTLFLIVQTAGRIDPPPSPPETIDAPSVDASAERIDRWLQRRWTQEDITPAAVADDLIVYRRLSLALHGTIPSLEEIRRFMDDDAPRRLDRWLLHMLQDDRFADYFSERLVRMLVGNEEGPFLIFRRDRLRDWMADQLRADRPWSETAEQLIAGDGLWTEEGHANFLTAAFIDDEQGLDENKLAGKTVRAFLGQRMDCAQCHDHFFADWKQTDFQGLAAFYGQARVTPGGVIDRKEEEGQPVVYRVFEPGDTTGQIVEPAVPFHEEWCPSSGTRRRRLAAWIVHPDNRRFRRAIANRVWGLLFGRPWHEPVDDIPDPGDAIDLLDVLAEEFAAHNDSLHRLIRMIARSRAFRMRSDVPGISAERYAVLEKHHAVFPLVRLRPEQVIGAMVQAAGIMTIDQNSHLLTRIIRFTSESDFMQQYGELPEDELLPQTGTIPQALLRMNGPFTRELTRAELLQSAGQILSWSPSDDAVVENCFLTCLTRLPTDSERQEFLTLLQDASAEKPDETAAEARKAVVEDLFWMLFNSVEFSWNH